MSDRSGLAIVKKVRGVDLGELLRLREGIATLAVEDPVYLPIFERLESEILAAQAKDPVSRARALVAGQRAMA